MTARPFLGFVLCLLPLPALAADRDPLPPGAVAKFRHDAAVTALAFAPDGSIIVSGSLDGAIRVWDAATGEHRRKLPGHRDGVNAICVTPDGKSVISCGCDAIVPLHELATGKEVRRFELKLPPEAPDPPVPHQVISVELSVDGSRVSAYSMAHTPERAAYHVWNAATGQSVVRRGFPKSPTYLALAADGRSVVEYISPPNAQGDDLAKIPLALRDLGTGRIRMTFPPSEEFDLRVALTADGVTLATVTTAQAPQYGDGAVPRSTIHLFDIPTGKEFLTMGSERNGLVHAVEKLAFSPDGRWLATVHSNRSAIVWDTRTGRTLLTMTGLDVAVTSLAFSWDGRRLATGHADGTALIWSIPPDNRPGRALAKTEWDALWTNLGSVDPHRVRTAMARLGESPKETIVLFAERLTPVPPLPADKIPGWLTDLSASRFAAREAASQALAALADRVESHLIDYVATEPPAEGRRRAERLLSAISPIPAADVLQRLRAITVLMWIGTPEARAILSRMAAGDPTARETIAAHAALRCKYEGRGEQARAN